MTAVAPSSADVRRLRKERGAFFTPPVIARFLARWAIRDPDEHVVDPSCGDGAFLGAAAERLAELCVDQGVLGSLGCVDGVELHAESAGDAQALLAHVGVAGRVTVGDFFGVEAPGSYDAVVGNPPYVRYQDFIGDARSRSSAAALRAGVRLTKLASSWAAFAVHAAMFLRPGGRMGLVLPAELLSVNYAAEVRAFLLRSFARVDLVVFSERVFPGVLEEVVLLLADGYRRGPAEHAGIIEARNAADLAHIAPSGRRWRPERPEGKWTPSLLPAVALEQYEELLNGGGFSPLQTWGETTLGMVTGNNRYFTLTSEEVAEYGLMESDVLPISPSGSRHLRGLEFTSAAWQSLGDRGARTWLFRPGRSPSARARAYVEGGRSAGVPEAYKCRVREPWWQVPLVPPADLIVTCMNADTPRLVTNLAAVRHLNSVHGLYLRAEHRAIGADLLAAASLNTLTLLGAETVGRSYGGGMLKLEPREADLLPVPSPELIAEHAETLAAMRPSIRAALARGDLPAAVRLVDDLVLGKGLGVDEEARRVLVDAHRGLADRRVARGRRVGG